MQQHHDNFRSLKDSTYEDKPVRRRKPRAVCRPRGAPERRVARGTRQAKQRPASATNASLFSSAFLARLRVARRLIQARALNVAIFTSLRDLLHHRGTRPQRMVTSSRMPSVSTIVSIGSVGQTL
jgi:hypothetical protein